MEFNDEISDLTNQSFAQIKQNIDSVIENISENNIDKLVKLSVKLKEDKRKNVLKLGEKIDTIVRKHNDEIIRVKSLYDFDKNFGNYKYVAGVDEVGRGPLAGPIVSAAVVLDLNFVKDSDLILYINDSKKLSESVRESLSDIIKEKALAYSIVAMDNNEIDAKGIAYCNNEVLRSACCKLNIKPDLVLSDGYAVKNLNIKNEFVIKGDSKSASIACASIIAKVYRDKLMKEYDKIYPGYGFAKHVGYGTKEHIQSIKEIGITPIHRKSFLTNIISRY
jgi:ribonuclease HII